MEKTVLHLDWRPIATAPADANLELSIYDKGEYHTLVFPCRRDGAGWRDVCANRPVPLLSRPIGGGGIVGNNRHVPISSDRFQGFARHRRSS